MNKEVCDRFMCKGELPLWGILLLILLVILDGIFYGFAAALQNLNESDVEKRSEAGDKKEGRLLYLISHPARYINTIPLLSALTVVCHHDHHPCSRFFFCRGTCVPAGRYFLSGTVCKKIFRSGMDRFRHFVPAGYSDLLDGPDPGDSLRCGIP